MVRGKIPLLLLGLILIFGNLAVAESVSGSTYSMEVGVDDGGGETTGGGLTLKSILGTISGVLTSGNLQNLLGFFYGLDSIPQLLSATLTSTSGTNYTTENLTSSYELAVYSNNNSNVVRDWRVDGTSLAVLNMPLDVDEGTTFRDYSTNENNGSCSGDTCPTWTSEGKVGGAYVFDGVNDYINVPYGSGLDPSTNPFTLSMWVKSENPSANLMFASTGQTPNNNARMYLATYGGDWEMGSYTSALGVGTTDATTDWTYITLVMNGTYAKLYINDNFDHQKLYSSYSFNEDIDIGRHASSTYYWNGSIDEVQIYNYSLSPEQIQANYQAGLANHSNDVIVSQETTKGENYSVVLTPNYQSMEGDSLLSNYLLIRNSVPSISSVIIDSTGGTPHMPGDNISITSISGASDGDNDEITNTTDWRESGVSLTVLNMPFNKNESGAATDYSTYGHNGTCSGSSCPIWTSEGKVGGAYTFDGVNDYIDLERPLELNLIPQEDEFTISQWFRTSGTGTIYSYGASGIITERQIQTFVSSGDFYYNIGGGNVAISSPSVNDGLWPYAVVVVPAASYGVKVYIDGVEELSNGSIGSYFGSYNGYIGARTDGTGFPFNGSIDEVQIYNYTLSEEQIQANYQAGLANHSNDILVSQEVYDDDVYTVAITPTDGEEDGLTVLSNEVTINNTPPTVTLTYPLGENITDRTPTFTWTCDDAQTPNCVGLTYEIDISEFYYGGSGTNCVDNINKNNILGNKYYTPSDSLKCLTDYHYGYNWAVRAYDGYEWSEWDNSTFGVASNIVISLENTMMNFENLDPVTNYENDTTNDVPLPFTLNNDGNVKINVTYDATELWNSQNAKESDYQIKVRDGSASWIWAAINWLNVSFTGDVVLFDQLNYESNNSAQIDIALEVPQDESPGQKDSLITFTASLGEPGNITS